MIKLKDILTEKYEIDLEIGDTILRGKFKNKPVVVKDFGVDDKGQPTINGKKMLSFRIKKLMPKKESIKEGRPIPQDTPNEFAYVDFKKWAYKKRSKIKKQMLSLNGDGSKIFRAMELVWQTWAKTTNNKNYTSVKNPSKFGRALVVMLVKDDLVFSKKAWNKDNRITHVKD